MSTCNYCGKEIGDLPFKCKNCGNLFCSKHRLLENHECKFDFEGSIFNENQKLKAKKQSN
ncbi:MAG: AN1-type zinc finger domain-containing protein [Promethearchaeota archaeon]